MTRSVDARRVSRRAVSILANLALLAGLFAVTTTMVAARPSTPATLTYHFTDCTGPAGTPTTMDGVKQPGEGAALHLTDGSGIYVLMEAIDPMTGEVFFTTPGFQHNNRPTVTCELIHPVDASLSVITGVIVPAR